MARQRRPPALRRAEVEAFKRACGQLDALAAMLNASGWNGKGMALVALSQAYEPIARIYNRCEAAMLGLPEPENVEPSRSSRQEGGSGESSESAPRPGHGSMEV